MNVPNSFRRPRDVEQVTERLQEECREMKAAAESWFDMDTMDGKLQSSPNIDVCIHKIMVNVSFSSKTRVDVKSDNDDHHWQWGGARNRRVYSPF